MGALVMSGTVGDKNVKVNCGGGFSIKQRAQIWANHTRKPVTWKQKVGKTWVSHTEYPSAEIPTIIGLMGEVRADALTKSESSDTWSMRFPRFKILRGFKIGEKL